LNPIWQQFFTKKMNAVCADDRSIQTVREGSGSKFSWHSGHHTMDAPEDGSSGIPAVELHPPGEHENENDDQDGADDTDAAMPIAVAIAAEAATESTEQQNDQEDNKDSSK